VVTRSSHYEHIIVTTDELKVEPVFYSFAEICLWWNTSWVGHV